MATNYPGTAQTFTNPVGTNTLDSPDHATLHSSSQDTIVQLEYKVGVGAGSPVVNQVLVGSGNGTSGWSSSWATATLGSATLTGGTANSITLGTPVMGAWTTSGTTVASVPAVGIAPTVITLSDAAAGTITANAPSGQVFHTILGTTAGNRTIGTPTNASEGQAITYRLKQNAAATGTLVWAAIFRFSSNVGTPALGTASTYNYYGWRYNNIDTKWDFQGQSINVI